MLMAFARAAVARASVAQAPVAQAFAAEASAASLAGQPYGGVMWLLCGLQCPQAAAGPARFGAARSR